jgi:hypothetical protein
VALHGEQREADRCRGARPEHPNWNTRLIALLVIRSSAKFAYLASLLEAEITGRLLVAESAFSFQTSSSWLAGRCRDPPELPLAARENCRRAWVPR